MEDLPIEKIAISGPTLASMIQRLSTSSGNVDGLLFGHITHVPPSTLSDDSSPSSSSSSSFTTANKTLFATVTGFLCSGTTLSFYSHSGHVDRHSLPRILPDHRHLSLLGWFSSRRRSPLRPSMREFSVTSSLSSDPQLCFPVQNSQNNPTTNLNLNFAPCLFLLFASPISDQTIHTHEYRAYQFRVSAQTFVPKSIDVVNIGPAFRGHYGSFSPNSPFPMLPLELGSSPMVEDDGEGSLGYMRRTAKDQKTLDFCAEGYKVEDLSRLIGPEAAGYTDRLEDFYEKMLSKLESLARQVERSEAMVREQEQYNRKLRQKVARMD